MTKQVIRDAGAVARPSAARWLGGRVLPSSQIGRQLAGISLLDALGSGMYYTGAALYFVGVVGLSAGQVGLGLSIGGFVGLVGGIPVGMLADRVRVGGVYIGLQVLRGLCYTVYCFAGSFPVFAIAAALIGLTDAAIPPVHQAVVGATVSGSDRVDTLAKIRAVRNIGFGAGAVLAVAAIDQGSRWAFLILIGTNAASYYIVALLMRVIGIHRVASGPQTAQRRKIRVVADVRYSTAALLNGVLAVHATILSVALPLWFGRHTKMPTYFVGVLVMINTVLAVVLQANFAQLSATMRGAIRAAQFAGLALAGFGICCLLAHESSTAWGAILLALIAVTFLTFAELWQSGSGWMISYELADPQRRTAYLSTFQLGTSLQAVIAPWVLTAVLFPLGTGWIIFAVVTATSGLLIGVILRPHNNVASPVRP